MVNVLRRSKYALAILAFFAVVFALKMPTANSLSGFTTTYYALTYENGFISRAFIGSIIFLFTDFLSKRAMYILVTAATLCTVALASFFASSVLQKLDATLREGASYILLLFLATPTSLVFLFKDMYFGRLDLYIILFTLLLTAFADKKYLCLLCPILCTACILTHQVYLFTYMPIAGIVLLYRSYKNNFSKGSIALCAASYAPIIALFSYFQFADITMPFESSESMTAALEEKTSVFISEYAIRGEYFLNIDDWWVDYVWPIMKSDAIPDIFYTLLILLPFFTILFCVWKTSYKLCENKFMKFIIFLCIVSPSAPIVTLIVLNDSCRWFASLIITQIVLLFYLLYSGEKCVCDAVEKMTAFFKRHVVLAPAVVAYTALFAFSAAYEL